MTLGTTLAPMQGLAPADTVATVAARDTIDWIVAAAAGSVVLLTLLLLVTVVFVFVQARQARRGLAEVSRKLSGDPAMESLRRAAENVARVSDAVRDEVERFSGSVARLSDQLERASARIEERIDEFNALLKVVQREAEQAFVEGASKARGVQAGLGALRSDPADRGSGARQTDGSSDGGRAPLGREGERPHDAHPDDSQIGDPGGEAREEARSEEDV